jgi:uncharacterized membrane protein
LTLEGVIDTSFDQIRQSGRGNVAIRIRLLEKIAALTNETENEPTRQALERQARMIEHENEGDQAELDDQQDVRRRYQEVISNSRE